MGYVGLAVMTDPDVFALAGTNALLERDMGGAAVMARLWSGDARSQSDYASSVMRMDCARLKHWNWAADFEKVFLGKYDYRDLNFLRVEPAGSAAPLKSQWNDFDRLQGDTKMLHNTQQRTQPWKTGLPADFTLRKRICDSLRRARGLHRHACGRDAPEWRT